jgi:ribosome maturation factor RimP
LRRRRGGHKLPSSFGKVMIDRTLVTKLVEERIAGTDMFIVDIETQPDNIISIVIDSDTAISIDNCADINRFVYSSLESQSEEFFEVRVYSAGLSEPFKLRRQYLKHIGEEVEILRKSGEKQRGILRHVEDNYIEIEYAIKQKEHGIKKKKTVQINEKIETDSIKLTKLVLKI